jgi:hypothetical protein
MCPISSIFVGIGPRPREGSAHRITAPHPTPISGRLPPPPGADAPARRVSAPCVLGVPRAGRRRRAAGGRRRVRRRDSRARGSGRRRRPYGARARGGRGPGGRAEGGGGRRGGRRARARAGRRGAPRVRVVREPSRGVDGGHAAGGPAVHAADRRARRAARGATRSRRAGRVGGSGRTGGRERDGGLGRAAASRGRCAGTGRSAPARGARSRRWRAARASGAPVSIPRHARPGVRKHNRTESPRERAGAEPARGARPRHRAPPRARDTAPTRHPRRRISRGISGWRHNFSERRGTARRGSYRAPGSSNAAPVLTAELAAHERHGAPRTAWLARAD